MKRMNETVSRQLRKFTSELTAVGSHNVVDLTDEDAVIDAFRTIQKYVFGILQEANDIKTAPARRKTLMGIVSKGKQELKELKPFIRPETVYELEMSFRNLGNTPKKLSEHKECFNMDKKLGKGFEDAIDELVGLSGAYEGSDEPMKNCCDIFADVAAELDCCDGDCDENEMSDAMGMELKDNDEELNEAIKDFLPRAGFIRSEEGGKMGGFIGNGSDETIKKAKALARARFQYLGDRMGRVSKDDVKHFDERFYEITGRYPTEDDLNESVQVQPDMLNSDFDRAYVDGKEAVDFGELRSILSKVDPEFYFVGEYSNNGYTYFRFEKTDAMKPEVFAEERDELRERLKERYGNDAVVVRSGQNPAGYGLFVIRVVDSDFLYDGEEIDRADGAVRPKFHLKSLKESDEAVDDEVAVADFDAEADVDENPADEIRMDVPLFMRCLEFAREEAQDDMDLHHLVEKAVELSKGDEALTMEAYADLIGEDAADEAPIVDAPIEEACEKPLKEGCTSKRKWKRIEKKAK